MDKFNLYSVNRTERIMASLEQEHSDGLYDSKNCSNL